MNKHQYLITDNFIFCILSEDKNFFYGEILYGIKKVKNVKKMQLKGLEYYKYWDLANRKKGGNYKIYFKKVKKLYPHESFNHPLIGKLFRFDKTRKYVLLPLKNSSSLNIKLKNELNGLLGIDSFYIGGSHLLEISNKNDLDIIVKGINKNKKVSKELLEIIKKKEYALKESNSLNRRRFRLLNNTIICPFGISRKDNIFEKNFIKKIGKKRISAKVVDNSLSLLSPAVYKLNVNGRESYLISYYVGHNHLLNLGENIKFTASLCLFKQRKIPLAYVIPIQGSWIDILSP